MNNKKQHQHQTRSKKKSSRGSRKTGSRSASSPSFWMTMKLPGRRRSLADQISPKVLFSIAVSAFCLAVIFLSRFDCFHVHRGVIANIKDLKYTGRQERVKGYMDHFFNVEAKRVLDDEAKALMAAHPHIRLDDLDLDIILSAEDLGIDGNALNRMDVAKAGSTGHADLGGAMTSVGRRAGEELVVKITGDMVRSGLAKLAGSMPMPEKKACSSE